MAKTRKPNQKMQAWIDARKRHHLSHVQEQMARELGMNPMKLGKLDNHEQEPWKMPLREYIEHVYLKRFGKPSPDDVKSIEERWRLAQEKKEARRASRRHLSVAAPRFPAHALQSSSGSIQGAPPSDIEPATENYGPQDNHNSAANRT